MPQPHTPPADLRTYDEVCQSICMLTCILNDVQSGSPQYRRAGHGGSDEAGATGPGTSKLKVMQHITTLLTTGTPGAPKTPDTAKKDSDHYTTKVIAVTGRVRSQDNSMEILVTRSPHLQRSPREVMEVRRLESETDGQNILQAWDERSLEDHFADVFTILDWLRVNGAQGDPLTLFQPPVPLPDAMFPYKLKGIARFTRDLIIGRGLLPSTTNRRVFIIDKNNLVSWLLLLCDVYQELDNILLEPPTASSETRTSKAGLMDLVLEDDAFLESLRFSCGSAVDAHHKNNTVKILATESLRMPGEQHHTYVLRYLKTIAAWIEAFSWATSSRNLSVILRPYELLVPLHPFVIRSDDQILQFEQRLLDRLQDRVTAKGLGPITTNDKSKLQTSNIRTATVHAEATLMGVACASWNTEVTQNSPPAVPIEDDNMKRSLRDMFAVQEVSIGASKLCCWCCWKLRTLLGELNDTDVTACPRFTLSGTHATIFPWYPPPCGIPRSVLVEMEKELILEVEKLVRRRAYESEPHQSSPSSADPQEGEGGLTVASVDSIEKAIRERI
ncbi:hypothetical protein OF83DRAFT_1179761 [Amylostereum chailletii]|nr:hypothetical protein OF83DRAFT_1179761 [Amylostereum chailletii]